MMFAAGASADGGPGLVAASVGALGGQEPTGALIRALDAVDDAMRGLDQELRRQLGVSNIDIVALQFIDRRQRRGASTRVRDLAPRLGVSTGTATTIVKRLERASLVKSAADPTDGRGRTIVLALHASNLVQDLLAPVRTDLQVLLESIPADQERELLELLGRVQAILTHTAPPEPEQPAA